MRTASLLLLSMAVSGCYASHEVDSDAGTEDAAAPDAGACFEAEADVYLRNDCEFCNAFHYTWLRRCGDRVFVTGGFEGGIVAGYRLGECGALTLDACARLEACLPLSDCDAYRADSLEALLAMRADFSPRGGALPFEPFEGDAPFAEAPTCDGLAERTSACE